MRRIELIEKKVMTENANTYASKGPSSTEIQPRIIKDKVTD